MGGWGVRGQGCSSRQQDEGGQLLGGVLMLSPNGILPLNRFADILWTGVTRMIFVGGFACCGRTQLCCGVAFL